LEMLSEEEEMIRMSMTKEAWSGMRFKDRLEYAVGRGFRYKQAGVLAKTEFRALTEKERDGLGF
jgi:hypothetical protein